MSWSVHVPFGYSWKLLLADAAGNLACYRIHLPMVTPSCLWTLDTQCEQQAFGNHFLVTIL